MTQEQLVSLFALLAAKEDGEGWWHAPADRFLNLYVSHQGALLTAAKVEAVRPQGELLRARTSKGEDYVMVAGDLFAVSLDAPSASGRKAGFGSGG